MSVSLAPTFGVGYQSFGVTGLPNYGGFIYTYAAGTTTPQATYTSSSGATPNSQPIQLDSSGRPPQEIWLTDGLAYKFVVTDALGIPIPNGTYDNISGGVTSTALAASSGSSLIGFLQAGTGAVADTVQSEIRRIQFDVVQFGAIGNWNGTTGTDDSAAIQAAATAAGLVAAGLGLGNYKRVQLVFPQGYAFYSSIGITVPANVDVLMYGALVYGGAAGATGAALAIGSATAETRGGTFELSVFRATQSNWSSDADIGIQLINIVSSDIRIKRVRNFCTGFQLYATGASAACYYNNIYLGEMRGCQYSVDLNNTAGGINANNWYGGECAVSSGEGVNATSRYGFRLRGTSQNNANQFWGPSFELSAALAAPGEAIPFLIETGAFNNRGHDCRTEANTDTLVKVTSTTARNNVFNSAYPARASTWPGYTGGGITDASYGQTNRVNVQYQEYLLGAHLVFDSGELGRKTNIYDGSTTYTVDGFDIGDSGFSLFTAQTLISPQDDTYLTFQSASRNLVRFIDTAVNKRFLVVLDFGQTAQSWRHGIKPFDAKRLTLTDNPTPPHVFGEDANQFVWQAGFYGGAYTSSGSGVTPYSYFAVDAATKAVAFVLESANGLKVKSIRIYAIDYPCVTWQEKREREYNGSMIASAIPTVDTFTRGDRIYQHLATAAAPEGWECTVSGTFGALAGVTANTTINQPSVVLNSGTNVQVGMYITIAGVTGVKRVIGKDPATPTNITVDVNCDATVSGAAVAYQAPTLRPLQNVT